MDVSSFIEKDRFGKYLGIEIADYSPGYAMAKMEIKADHLNSLGTVHGGVFLPCRCGLCSCSQLPRETLHVNKRQYLLLQCAGERRLVCKGHGNINQFETGYLSY